MWWTLRHKVRKFWYEQIASRINPRQKWLTNAIGRTWADKDWVLETCVFTSMIHFWEDERGEEVMRYQFECIENPCRSKALNAEDQERYAEARRVYSILDRCYRWAKARDQLWEDFHESGYDAFYNKREADLIEQDTSVMQEIIQYRKYMWT